MSTPSSESATTADAELPTALAELRSLLRGCAFELLKTSEWLRGVLCSAKLMKLLLVSSALSATELN